MKMTTEITHRYFEFSPKNGAYYYALIAADSKQAAIDIYYRDISDRDDEPDADCKELTSAEAWDKCKSADDVEGELSIEELLEEFEGNGIILWPLELIQ
ncbi:hypothetical protein OUY26_05160 [Levilactobacillus brevis]|uniref:hypothetical protein n=1 Tax=Levilactobacillus brevis TaxID=1580 RepID=UPI000D367BE0|nr:hypothetical protein [Levilactobacillus brevis]PUD96034.1 hypothetical protein DA477_09450 [Levilactobacillus brevis]WAE45971.1 hypothetical protein OUY26_05160 [Levilactobacillus brevis]